MFCNKCGNKLGEGARFCTGCGNKIENPAAEPAVQPDEINPAFYSGEEKTVYLPEEDNVTEEKGSEISAPAIVPEEDPQQEEVVIGDIPDEELSDDPASVDAGFLGEEKTVLLKDEQDDFSDEKTVLLKEEDFPAQFPQEQPAQTFPQEQPQQQFPQGQPAQMFPQEQPQQQFPQGQPAQMFPHGQQPQMFPQEQPPVGQYIQGGMIPDISAVPPIAPPPEVPAAPVKVGKGRIFGASVVALFAIIFLMLVSLITSLKIGASGRTLNKRVTKLDLNTVLNAEFDKKELSDNLYGTIKFGSVTNGSATVSDFKEYLKKSDILEYAGENIENYANYIIDGKGKDPSITSEDIGYDFFAENNDAAYEVFDYELSKKDIKKIIGNLENEGVDDNLSIKEWGKKAGTDMKNISYVLSYITVGILFALVLVLMIWIAIIVDKKGRHIMGFFGNILFISGLVVFLCGVGITAGMMIAFSLTSNVVFYLAYNILLDFGILALIIGFSELVIGFIFKKIGKSIKKKNKLAKASEPVNQNPVPVPVYN